MARSHHRKSHKDHLRQFQGQQKSADRKNRSAGTLAVIGIILGLALGYFGSGSDPVWIAGAGIAGGLAGYLIGRYLDKM
jgi:hypothetical protein